MRAEPDSSTAAAHTARIRGSYDTVRQQRQQLSATKIPSHPSLDRPTERRNTKNKSEPESQKSQIQIQIQSTQVLPPKSFHPPSTSRPPAHTLTLRRPRAHTPPSALRHPRRYGPPTLLPLASVTAYSCFSGSQLSAQLGTARRPRTPIRIACGFANAGGGGALGERSCGLLCAVSYRVDVQNRGGKGRRGGGGAYLALSVGPSASRAKLCGKSGLPGPRSPTTSYGISLLVVDEA